MNKFLHVFLALLFLMPCITMAHAGAVENMPEFSLPSALDGKEVKSKDLKGKVLLITFFATWCPPCRQEIPSLMKLHDEFSSKGFSVIGISIDEKGPGVVNKLIEKEKINYPVLMASGKTTWDFGGVVGIPTSFLVDRQGAIVKRYPGYIPKAVFEKDIKDIL